MPNKGQPSKAGYWYFGGVASAMAAACTHPLDLIKVHLQTQQKRELGMISMGIRVFKNDGLFALYNGLSASVLRQLTYSMTRFGLYESYKNSKGVSKMSFAESAGVSMASGFVGGINAERHEGIRSPKTQVCLLNIFSGIEIFLIEMCTFIIYSYKHAIDGLIRVAREEGAVKLFNGVTMTSTRAAFMTFGQLAFYDKFKQVMILSGYFHDNPVTHVLASVSAAGIATCMTQPFDVMKTRLMNAPPGTYSGLASCGLGLIKAGGPLAFFKGLVPAFIRLGPHTVLTFVFLEQLKQNFGYIPT
ncbi:unnamed protein product [Protopolystoma xenopodis]|uniref:Mitochondrial dicarboxylate carrier n=1 Tax=Protopolystoma xenopodis TaxID=117903 RepID=A0A448XGS0_9PLAT|nr:unnamed protein product [Protopolystoma xenopodis]